MSLSSFFPNLSGFFGRTKWRWLVAICLCVVSLGIYLQSSLPTQALFLCSNGGSLNTSTNKCEMPQGSGGTCPVSWVVSGSICVQDATLHCDYLDPSNATRNLNLTDAELRADQDFRCKDIGEFCVQVFQDLNSDGIKNNSDSLLLAIVSRFCRKVVLN